MRQISVEYSDAEIKSMSSDYSHSGLKIALCTKLKNYKVKRLTSFETCREAFTGVLRTALVNPKAAVYGGGDLTGVDKSRLRFLIYLKLSSTATTELQIKKCKSVIDKNLQIGLKLLNHYEKRHDWGVTKLYKTNNNGQFVRDGVDRNNHICVYMVVASKKWMTSPAMVSLHILMLRLGISGFKGKFGTHEELMKELRRFGNSNSYYDDPNYVAATHKKWGILLGNLNRIYRGRTLRNIYCKKSLSNGSEGFSEGISLLCRGASSDIIANRNFKKICEEYGIEQEATVEEKLKKDDQLEEEIARLRRRRI